MTDNGDGLNLDELYADAGGGNQYDRTPPPPKRTAIANAFPSVKAQANAPKRKSVKRDVTINGMPKTITFDGDAEPTQQDLQYAKEYYLRKDYPEVAKQYDALTAQMKAKKGSAGYADLSVRRTNLLNHGTSQGIAPSDSTDPGFMGKVSNFVDDVANKADIYQTVTGNKDAANAVKNVVNSGLDAVEKYNPTQAIARAGVKAVTGKEQPNNTLSGTVNPLNWSLADAMVNPKAYNDKLNDQLLTGDRAGWVQGVVSPIADALSLGTEHIPTPSPIRAIAKPIQGGADAILSRFNVPVPTGINDLPVRDGYMKDGTFKPQSAYSDHQVAGEPNLLNIAKNNPKPLKGFEPKVDEGYNTANQRTPIDNYAPNPNPGEVKPFVHPDAQYPNWVQRTEGVISAIDKHLAEGVGRHKAKALRNLKSELSKSIKDSNPHPGIIDEYPKQPLSVDPTIPNPKIKSKPIEYPLSVEPPTPNPVVDPNHPLLKNAPTPTPKVVKPAVNPVAPPAPVVDPNHPLLKNMPAEPVKAPETASQPVQSTVAVAEKPVTEPVVTSEAPSPIIAGARKSVQSQLRPGGEIEAEALQNYTGPKEAVQQGTELYNSGANMDDLAKSLNDSPRPIAPKETVALIKHIGALVDHRTNLDSLILSPEESLAAFEKVNNQIQTAYDAIRKGGRESSASLNSLKMVLRKDMSMDTGAELVRKVSGTEAASDQMKACEELEKKHEQLSAAHDDTVNRLDLATKEITDLKNGTNPKKGGSRVAKGKADFESAKSELSDTWKELTDKLNGEDGTVRLGSGSPFTTEELTSLAKPIVKMVRAQINVGFGTAEVVLEKVARHLSEITGRTITADHVAQIYGDATGQTERGAARLTKLQSDIEYARKSGTYPSQRQVRILSKEAAELEAKMKALRSERNKIVRDSADPSTGEKFNSILHSIQLIDPIARGIDFVANGVKMASYLTVENPVRYGVGKGINKAIGSNFVDPTAWGVNRAKRIFEGFGEGMKGRLSETELGGKYGQAKGGDGWNAGYRVAGLSDVPAKELYYRMHLDAAAEQMARAELPANAPTKLIDARTRYHTANASRTMKAAAEEFADMQTFNSKSAVSHISEGVKKAAQQVMGIEGGKIGGAQLSRFWNVMANVAQDRIDRTVIGSTSQATVNAFRLAKEFRATGIADPVKARRIATLIAKGSTGAGLAYAGAELQDKYKFVTIKRNEKGGAPFIDTGVWEQVGGPFSQFLQGAANRAIETSGLSEVDKRNLKLKNAFMNVVSQPLFTQQQNLLNVAGNKADENSAVKTFGAMMGTYLIPSVFRRGAKAFDEDDKNVDFSDKVFGQGRPVDTRGSKNPDGTRNDWEQLYNEFIAKNVPGLRNKLKSKPISEVKPKGQKASPKDEFQKEMDKAMRGD